MARNPTKEHYEVVRADLHDRKWRLETQRREIDAVIGGLDRSIRVPISRQTIGDYDSAFGRDGVNEGPD